MGPTTTSTTTTTTKAPTTKAPSLSEVSLNCFFAFENTNDPNNAYSEIVKGSEEFSDLLAPSSSKQLVFVKSMIKTQYSASGDSYFVIAER